MQPVQYLKNHVELNNSTNSIQSTFLQIQNFVSMENEIEPIDYNVYM